MTKRVDRDAPLGGNPANKLIINALAKLFTFPPSTQLFITL